MFRFATPMLRRTLIAAVLLMAMQPAQAADGRDYALPAAPLAGTLNRIATEAGLVLSVDPALLADRQSAPVQGHYEPEAALREALRGSGLMLVPGDGGVWTLRPAQGATMLPAVRVEGAARSDASAGGVGSYAGQAVTIGKLSDKRSEIPQTVSVVTRQRLDDQNLNSLEMALGQATGITLRKRAPSTPASIRADSRSPTSKSMAVRRSTAATTSARSVTLRSTSKWKCCGVPTDYSQVRVNPAAPSI